MKIPYEFLKDYAFIHKSDKGYMVYFIFWALLKEFTYRITAYQGLAKPNKRMAYNSAWMILKKDLDRGIVKISTNEKQSVKGVSPVSKTPDEYAQILKWYYPKRNKS